MKILRNIRQKLAAENKVAAYSRYALGEVFIVLIGVLLAFALNSWWNSVKEIHTRKIILTNLLNEMLYNRQKLQQTIRIDEFVLRNTEILEKILQNSEPGKNIAIADTLLSAFIVAATNNPSTGSLNSILTSGKIDHISNNDLITSIITWNNKFDDASEDEKTAFEFIENHFLPDLQEQVDISRILDNSGGMAQYAKTGSKNKLPPEFITGTVDIKCSNSLINLVSQRRMRLQIVLGALKRLQNHQMQMLELIQQAQK